MTRQQARGSQEQAAAASPPPVGRTYLVGGRQLWLHRSGTGAPPVVFLPGASAVGLDYLNIHDLAAARTTSVLYDRGGTGWSGPAELPRTAAEVATELRDLLVAAGVPGPYLMVAHSLGAGYARRFAQLYPAEVAGVLYLEAFYEETDAYMPERLHLARLRQPNPGPLQLRLMRPFMRRMYAKMFAGWPEQIRRPLIEAHLSPQWWQVGVKERGSAPALAGELKQGGELPDVPVIVLTALGVDPGMRLMMPAKTLHEMTDAKHRLYEALAGSVTRGEHRELEHPRHSTITIDRADAVIQAIRALLDEVSCKYLSVEGPVVQLDKPAALPNPSSWPR